MAVTTYLLGAGASVSAIPVVENLAPTLSAFENVIKRTLDDYPVNIQQMQGIGVNYKQIISGLYNDTHWLVAEVKNHTSIDTFAKKLYLKGDLDKLLKLKNVLNFFFSYIQTPDKVDIRYDNFLASILQKDVNDFPKKIRILSWNYDSQLEIAYSNLTGNGNIEQCRIALNILLDKDISGSDTHTDNFSVFKLNGTAGLYDESNEFRYCGFMKFQLPQNNRYTSSDLDSLLKTYADSFDSKKYRHSLTFAWENFEAKKGYFEKIKNSVNETEALVIIGYSFPFFNRGIDKYLINECMPGLRYIYIQDPQAEIIKQRLRGIINIDDKSVELLDREDNKQFAFANELEL